MCATNRGSASGSWQTRRGINAARNVFQSKTVHRQISRMKPGGLGGDLGGTEAEGVIPDETVGKGPAGSASLRANSMPRYFAQIQQ